MILTLIGHEQERLDIYYPYVDYSYWSRLPDYLCDDWIVKILDQFIEDLDCRREYSGRRIIGTEWPKYQTRLSNYLYLLLKINNQLIYNEYVDKIISLHYNNLAFEHEYPCNADITSTNKRKRKAHKQKALRIISTDMFDGNTVDITGSVDTHNIVKKKKKTRNVGVPMELMTYSFKKKNNEQS